MRAVAGLEEWVFTSHLTFGLLRFIMGREPKSLYYQQWVDLTYLAGAPAAAGPPWPYNRSVVSSIYLPLVVRR